MPLCLWVLGCWSRCLWLCICSLCVCTGPLNKQYSFLCVCVLPSVCPCMSLSCSSHLDQYWHKGLLVIKQHHMWMKENKIFNHQSSTKPNVQGKICQRCKWHAALLCLHLLICFLKNNAVMLVRSLSCAGGITVPKINATAVLSFSSVSFLPLNQARASRAWGYHNCSPVLSALNHCAPLEKCR